MNDDIPSAKEDVGFNYITVKGAIIHETEKALLLRRANGKENWWPFSTIDSVHTGEEPFGDSIVVEKWIALKNGIL